MSQNIDIISVELVQDNAYRIEYFDVDENTNKNILTNPNIIDYLIAKYPKDMDSVINEQKVKITNCTELYKLLKKYIYVKN